MSNQSDKCHTSYRFFPPQKALLNKEFMLLFSVQYSPGFCSDICRSCILLMSLVFQQVTSAEGTGVTPHEYVDLCPGSHVYSPCTVNKCPVVSKHWSKASHQMQSLTELLLDETMNLDLPLHPWNNLLLFENWLRSSFASRFPCWTNKYRK